MMANKKYQRWNTTILKVLAFWRPLQEAKTVERQEDTLPATRAKGKWGLARPFEGAVLELIFQGHLEKGWKHWWSKRLFLLHELKGVLYLRQAPLIQRILYWSSDHLRIAMMSPASKNLFSVQFDKTAGENPEYMQINCTDSKEVYGHFCLCWGIALG